MNLRTIVAKIGMSIPVPIRRLAIKISPIRQLVKRVVHGANDVRVQLEDELHFWAHPDHHAKLVYGEVKHFENDFRHSLVESLDGQEVVWDVGANLGMHTILIADQLSASGGVCRCD